MSEGHRAELSNCGNQIICFFASCLSDPDIFGPQSTNSVSDFAKIVGSEFHQAFGINLLRRLADELDSQNLMSPVRFIDASK